MRILDGSNATIKKFQPSLKIPELEIRQEVPAFLRESKDARAVFTSKSVRFDKGGGVVVAAPRTSIEVK